MMGLKGSEEDLGRLLLDCDENLEKAVNVYFERKSLAKASLDKVQQRTLAPLASASEANLKDKGKGKGKGKPKKKQAPKVEPMLTSGWLKVTPSKGSQSMNAKHTQEEEQWLLLGERAVIEAHATFAGEIGGNEPLVIEIHARRGRDKLGKSKGKRKATSNFKHLIFKSRKSCLEGRLPETVCSFLAPLLRAKLIRVDARGVYGMNPGMGEHVPLWLRIHAAPSMFDLPAEINPHEENPLYQAAYSLIHFVDTVSGSSNSKHCTLRFTAYHVS
ncbi:unnamed protein product [Chrysoparadoxa australica]